MLRTVMSRISKICSPADSRGIVRAFEDCMLLSDETLLASARVRVMCGELDDILQCSRSRSRKSSIEEKDQEVALVDGGEIERHHTGAQLLLDEDSNELADADAQFSLGYRYHERSDFETALQFYKLAALKLHGQSINNIGVILALGRGIAADEGFAIEWFRLGMELGDSKATLNYAILRTLPSNYEHMDREEAFKVMNSLRSNLESKGMEYLSQSPRYWILLRVVYNNLGCMYCRGLGTDADTTNSMKMFALAANMNSAIAKYNIGAVYLNGIGVEKNRMLASSWFEQAHAERDHPDMVIIGSASDSTKLLMVTTMMLD
eukprot:TRINITY_DN5826_c0_g1_i1.p1 TRINITY_DN5826_c0_g1~~TRINITY_DN5826_c0_g1_i1.p1  ORF type:complete len:320 (+),score=79.56 TRINITY_DN5826_c0_g1_i1:142-1101(+)